MTSVEPGVVDANILVYALDVDAPQHAASLALLNAARDPATILFVTSQILAEFYSIVTSPRRVAVPRSPSEALRALSALHAYPGVHVLPAPARVAIGWDGRSVFRIGGSDSALLINACRCRGYLAHFQIY
jgi:predicted nucleic acid-binding protein